MHLDLGGHPIHTRALSVEVVAQPNGRRMVSSDLLDLRKRGFTPVGTELQGAGIIHQMGLRLVVDTATRAVVHIDARQPVVAFEPSAATAGESCRDVAGGLATLVGMRLDDDAPERLREVLGGRLGCSHLLAAAQLLGAMIDAIRLDDPAEGATHARLFRRDLVIDGHELEPGRLVLGVQLNDIASLPAAVDTPPRARFTSHYELRLRIGLSGWPASIADLAGAERRRSRDDFASAEWRDLGALLAPLAGLTLAKGSNRSITEQLAAHPAARAALLQVAPALIQCRASFPDKWLNRAVTDPEHRGLIGMPDSCWMWRRGGPLQS